jgi:uncharacterized protein YjiS (DUF1127 family)
MNAYTSKEELALLPSSRISHAEHYTNDRAARPTLFARIAAFFERQSTLHELGQLTDRELADIGLNRAELKLVFEPAYANARGR